MHEEQKISVAKKKKNNTFRKIRGNSRELYLNTDKKNDDIPEQCIAEGRNAVSEMLKSGREIDKLYVAKDAHGANLSQIISEARKKRIPISYCDKRKLSVLSRTGTHQGVIAIAAAHSYASLEELLTVSAKATAPMFIICDGITDPRNLGAIIRSAEIFGANGVIITKHGGAGLNSACAKAAAGALEYVPVVRCSSLIKTIEQLKKNGLWIIGMGAGGEMSVFDADFTHPCAIVIGSEGNGISKGVLRCCDFIVKIPMKGKINSLNASAAAAIAMCEAVRMRDVASEARNTCGN